MTRDDLLQIIRTRQPCTAMDIKAAAKKQELPAIWDDELLIELAEMVSDGLVIRKTGRKGTIYLMPPKRYD